MRTITRSFRPVAKKKKKEQRPLGECDHLLSINPQAGRPGTPSLRTIFCLHSGLHEERAALCLEDAFEDIFDSIAHQSDSACVGSSELEKRI